MKRVISIASVLAIGLAMAGCGGSESAQSARTVTVTASPTVSKSPVKTEATPVADGSSMDTDTGTGDPVMAKFGQSFTLPENSDVSYLVGQPKLVKPWSTDTSSESASDYGDEAKGIVAITFTITNKGKTQYQIANSEDGVAGNYQTVCMADWPVPDNDSGTGMNTNPVNVKPGQSIDYTIHCGASKDGKLTMTIGPDGFTEWAIYSNEEN